MPAGRKKDGTFARGHSGNPSGRPRGDGYVSQVTGIGDPNWDKRLSHRMRAPILTYEDAIEMWRADDLAKRAIEAPIDECFRQGYEMVISDEGKFDDLKEQVEDKLQELQFTHIVKRAKCIERALGGAAILIGANDHRPLDEPLDVPNIVSVDWLTVLEPIEIQPVDWYRDPSAAKYGEVEYYQLTAFTTYGSTVNVGGLNERLPPPTQLRIHESRLVVFGGIKVSRYQIHNNVAGSLWGDSKLTSLIEVLRDFNVAWHAAGLLAVDFGQPVISVDNLMLLVAKNPGDFQARMRALEQGRSTARAIMIDAKKEKFERQTTTLTGFPELLNGLSMRLAAAVDMPLTLLMGMSPTGIGNEGTADVRFYYDRIKGKQATEIEPLIRMFIKMLMGTFRKRKLPKKWSVKFHELWQMSENEKAEARLTQARTDSLYLKGGVVTPDEIRKSRFSGEYSFETQINEHKKAPGFVTPPPAGTPGSAKNPDVPSNVHSVTSYTRKNPKAFGMEPSPKEGGDQAPADNQDAAPVRYAGFLVQVEAPAGSTRLWDGGATVLPYDYGSIEGAMGADGEDVDVYLGPEENAPWVFVVHQQRGPNFTLYDEDKVMLGFPSGDAAQEAYVKIYDQRFFGGMSMMPVEKFREKIYSESGKVSNAA
jgi:phage-related protein (TIGR01555 family)